MEELCHGKRTGREEAAYARDKARDGIIYVVARFSRWSALRLTVPLRPSLTP